MSHQRRIRKIVEEDDVDLDYMYTFKTKRNIKEEEDEDDSPDIAALRMIVKMIFFVCIVKLCKEYLG